MKPTETADFPLDGISKVHTAIHHEGRWFFTCDFDHKLIVVDNSNEMIVVGAKGDGPENLHYPCSIAVHDERLYICDSWNQRIQIRDLQGQLIDNISLTPPHPFEPVLPTVVVPAEHGLWVLERDAHRAVRFPWEGGGFKVEREQVVKGPIQYPHQMIIAGPWMAFIDSVRASAFRDGEQIYTHALKHPTYTRMLGSVEEGVLLYDEVDRLLLIWTLADGVLATVSSLPNGKILGVSWSQSMLHVFTGTHRETYKLPSFNQEKKAKSLIAAVSDAADAMEEANAMEGAIDGRWMDSFILEAPLPGRVLKQRGLFLRDALLSRLNAWKQFLEDASDSQASVISDLSETFLRKLQNQRQRCLEETISYAGKAVEDFHSLFRHDRRLFWYGFTQVRFANHLIAFFDRIGLEKPEMLEEASKAGANGSYLEPWSRDSTSCNQSFTSLIEAMGGNASTREALLSMAPYCEADHLAFLADPDPLRSRARRIANAYRAELAQFPNTDSDFPTLRFPDNIINLLRWYYWAGHTESHRKLMARLPQDDSHRLTRNGLAQIAILMGDHQAALTYYRGENLRTPNFVYALALLKNGRKKKALEHVNAFPDDQKREYFKGFLHLTLGNYEKAIAFFEDELRFSNYSWTIAQLVLAHACQDDLESAMTTLEKYREHLDPYISDYLRGILLRLQGHFDEALAVVNNLPPLAMARYQQGITLRCMEQFDAAMECFHKEDNDYPNWLTIVQNALTYQRMGKEKERDKAIGRLTSNHFVFSGNQRVHANQESFSSALCSLMETEAQVTLTPAQRKWREEDRVGLYKTSFFSRFLHHGDYVNLF